VIALALLYGGIYTPLVERRHALERRLPELRAQYRLSLAQVTEIERLRQRVAPLTKTVIPLSRQVESLAMARALAAHLVSITSLGTSKVQVIAEGRPPAEWMQWLLDLRSQGIVLENLNLTVDKKNGQAHLRAALVQAGTP